MKKADFIVSILITLFTFSAMADFVYMKEDAKGKSIQWNQNGKIIPLSDSNSGLWSLYPDIAPNGHEFIYSEGTGPQDLHLTYLNTKKKIEQRFYLPEGGMVVHPQFSGNGKYIFYSAPGPHGKNTIYYFDRNALVLAQGEGKAEYVLNKVSTLDASEESYFPRPSSDGQIVVYQRNQAEEKEIVLFNRIENKKVVLAKGMSPALSVDERWVAYTKKINGNWNIYLLDRFSGEEKQVTSDPRDEMAPTFTPQNTLVFASNRTGRFALYELTTDGLWLTLAEDPDADFYAPQYSGHLNFKQTELAPFIKNPRSSFGTVVHQGKVYMAGGHEGAEHTYPPESFTDTFVAYELASNTWIELPPRPHKAHGYQLAAFGNYIYAFGGFAYSETHRPRWKSLDAIDRYDILAKKWETIGRLKAPRSSNVAITLGHQVFIIGGWDATPKFENDYDGWFHQEIEIFNLKTEQVTSAPFTLPTPLRRAFTGIEFNGKLLLIGGLGEGATHFELLSHVTQIDPLDGATTELTPLPFATFAPAAGIIKGNLYVFGGMFKTGEMSYEYVPHIYELPHHSTTWGHTGRYLQGPKGFSQVLVLNPTTLGVLGGHRYWEGKDSPISTFETFEATEKPYLPDLP